MADTNSYTANGVIEGEKTAEESRVDKLTDTPGSVTVTVDQGAQVVDTYGYKPHGKQLTKTGTGVDPAAGCVGSQTYRPTHKKLSDSYIRTRYAQAPDGRWTTKHPSGDSGGVNAYFDAQSTPTVLTEPGGRQPKSRP